MKSRQVLPYMGGCRSQTFFQKISKRPEYSLDMVKNMAKGIEPDDICTGQFDQ